MCVGYVYTPMPCGRYILQSDFITSLDLHHESKVTIPPEFDRVPIRARCICPPVYLDDSISLRKGRGERDGRVGPMWSVYTVRIPIRGYLILAPVYEYERIDTRSGGKSKKDLRLIIISRRDAGADISRGNHCGIRSNERRS